MADDNDHEGILANKKASSNTSENKDNNLGPF